MLMFLLLYTIVLKKQTFIYEKAAPHEERCGKVRRTCQG